MELPNGFEKKTVITFDQRDLQALIKEVWDVDYDTGDTLDRPSNGSYYEYSISNDPESYEGEYYLDQGQEPWYHNDTDGWMNLERVIERLDHPTMVPGPGDVLTVLVELGKLPESEYILHFWW